MRFTFVVLALVILLATTYAVPDSLPSFIRVDHDILLENKVMDHDVVVFFSRDAVLTLRNITGNNSTFEVYGEGTLRLEDSVFSNEEKPLTVYHTLIIPLRFLSPNENVAKFSLVLSNVQAGVPILITPQTEDQWVYYVSLNGSNITGNITRVQNVELKESVYSDGFVASQYLLIDNSWVKGMAAEARGVSIQFSEVYLSTITAGDADIQHSLLSSIYNPCDGTMDPIGECEPEYSPFEFLVKTTHSLSLHSSEVYVVPTVMPAEKAGIISEGNDAVEVYDTSFFVVGRKVPYTNPHNPDTVAVYLEASNVNVVGNTFTGTVYGSLAGGIGVEYSNSTGLFSNNTFQNLSVGVRAITTYTCPIGTPFEKCEVPSTSSVDLLCDNTFNGNLYNVALFETQEGFICSTLPFKEKPRPFMPIAKAKGKVGILSK